MKIKKTKARLEPAMARTLARASKEVAKWPWWMRSADVEESRKKLKLAAGRAPAKFLRKVHSESLRAVAYDIRRGIMLPIQCAVLLERCADMLDRG